MRALTALPFALALALSTLPGCKEADAALEREAEAVTTAAPRAGQAAELKLLRGQIALHVRLNGAPPASLDALETMPHLKYAADYAYDPATGEVTSRRFPGL